MSRQKNHKTRLDHTIADIQLRYGSRAVQQGAAHSTPVPHLATGFNRLDEALVIGGIPRGKISVVRGAITSGKRTLAALLIAQAQKATRRSCAYLDLAGTCDADLLARCGVNLTHLYVLQPADQREALEMAVTLAERRELGVVVLDEWSQIVAERGARDLAAHALDQISARLPHLGVAFVVLDDLLSAWQGLVATWTDPVYNALAQHAAVRLALRRKRWIMLGPDMRGYEIAVTIERNKFGREGQTVEITIRYNGTVRGDGL